MEGMNNLPTFCFFQPMMPPYGPPYAAFYPPGGVYTHPAVAIVSVLIYKSLLLRVRNM